MAVKTVASIRAGLKKPRVEIDPAISGVEEGNLPSPTKPRRKVAPRGFYHEVEVAPIEETAARLNEIGYGEETSMFLADAMQRGLTALRTGVMPDAPRGARFGLPESASRSPVAGRIRW